MFTEKDLIINLPESDILEGAKGGFLKNIMIISTSNLNTDFCSKVLMAAQINMEQDTKFVELSNQVKYTLLAKVMKSAPEKIIVFGCAPNQLGLNIVPSKYVVFDFSGIKWLFADTLETIEADRNKKSQLWLALKNMFDLP